MSVTSTGRFPDAGPDLNREVATLEELRAATNDARVREIIVTSDLTDVSTIRLAPLQRLRGRSPETRLRIAPGCDGLQLTAGNSVESLTIQADPDRRALFNDNDIEDCGCLDLRQLTITGLVHLVAENRLRRGHVEVHDVAILAADARDLRDRPKGYGVSVVPGAFTLWNRQADPALVITADLTGLSIGRAGAPVWGSGVFVGGAGDHGARLSVRRLDTGPVHSHGGIAPGTPDRISGGVFVVHGATVDIVRNRGPVTTYGANDMVLDNWGAVDRWTAEDKITSFGPSGIGFVNFGTINRLEVNAPIETFGSGARGFNVYTGTVQSATFERIVTHGDGAVGIQLSQPVGRIAVRRGIETRGGTGDSLVKGVVVRLAAIPLSLKPGGSAGLIEIAGGVISRGIGIAPLELHGRVDVLKITDGFVPAGGGFDTI